MADAPLCVYCRRRPVEPPWRPFCGERCKMADLGRWLTGGYAVPGRSADDTDAPETADPNQTDGEHDDEAGSRT